MNAPLPENWQPPHQTIQRPPLLRATAYSPEYPTPWVAGVASGLSVHLGLPVGFIRTLFVVSTGFGVGLLAYLLLVALVPRDEGEAPDTTRGATPLRGVSVDRHAVTARNQLVMAGLGLLVFAALMLFARSAENISGRAIVSAVIAVAGLAMVWSQTNNVGQWHSVRFWGMLVGGLLGVVVGFSLFITGDIATAELLRGVIYGSSVVLIILATLIPLAVRASGQLSQAQEKQVRETERADIAAHLHDSVLQTLTLIRGAANNPAKVRALALTQERELRAWLYTGHAEAASSIAEALREVATNVEATYGTAIDLVCVGDLVPGPNELALVAAAGEAMKNAVRHGAPPVSAFLEVLPHSVEIYVKDRGSGFNLEDIPADRHGVRGSIIGRVERVGGHATLRRLEPGLEIRLSVPRSSDALPLA